MSKAALEVGSIEAGGGGCAYCDEVPALGIKACRKFGFDCIKELRQ